MPRGFTYLACFAALLIASGCSRSAFEVAPVHGVVAVDDKPLFQGKVMFAPVAKGDSPNPGKPAWGDIGSNGTFRLTTFKKDDGAVVGEHWVTIVNSAEQLPEGVPKFARFMVPKKVTVAPEKDNQIDIKLTSEVVREYTEDDR
jgi:hypothetical protein